MEIIYIKKSYEKLYKNRYLEYRKIQLGENIQISELVFSAKYIDEIFNIESILLEIKRTISRVRRNGNSFLCAILKIKNYIMKIKLKYKIKGLELLIRKVCLKNNLQKARYILSIDIEQSERINLIVIDLLRNIDKVLEKYICYDEYEKNLTKYIECHMKNKNLSRDDMNICMVYLKKSNIDKKILNNLLEQYKVVDIIETNNRISRSKTNIAIVDKLNEGIGSSISIININNRKIKEYNYIILMDSRSVDECKNTFDRKAQFISLLDINGDTLNTNIFLLDKMVSENKVNKEHIERLRHDYGLVILSKSIIDICGKNK